MAKRNAAWKQIKEATEGLQEIMEGHLAEIGEKLIRQLMSRARRLSPAQRLNALKDLSPSGVSAYREELLAAFSLVATDGIAQARKEVPKAANVKLADTAEDSVLLSDYDRLPKKLQKKIRTRLDLLVGKQLGDLQKVIEFAFATADEETDSDDIVENDVRESALGWLEGTAMQSGAALSASSIINEARNAFFFDDAVLEQIDAFQFVNGDPVTEVCQDLAGTLFSKSDPNADRYFPPLHWNCKSSIQPILAGNLGGRKTEPLKPSKSSLDQYVLFSEKCSCSDE